MKTWVVVASAARARIFEASGRLQPWKEIMDLVNTEERLARQDFTSDKPGRAIDSARGQRHTMEPTVDPKERSAMQFAQQLIEKLETELHDRKFEHLTLVAAPHFLGLLREKMGTVLARTVTGEVTKDLTRESSENLQEHVAHLTR